MNDTFEDALRAAEPGLHASYTNEPWLDNLPWIEEYDNHVDTTEDGGEAPDASAHLFDLPETSTYEAPSDDSQLGQGQFEVFLGRDQCQNPRHTAFEGIGASIGAQFEPLLIGDDGVGKQGSLSPIAPITISPDSNSPMSGTDTMNPTGIDESLSPEIQSGVDAFTEVDLNDVYSSPKVQNLPAIDHRIPTISISDASSNDPLPPANNVHKTLVSQNLVEQVRRFVHELNETWMLELSSAPELYSHHSVLSTSSLFERGLQALHQCTRGELPQTFQAIFAFMHVAFASAYVVHKGDTSSYLDDFKKDALLWRHAISAPIDITIFARVGNRLWSPRVNASNSPASCRPQDNWSIASPGLKTNSMLAYGYDAQSSANIDPLLLTHIDDQSQRSVEFLHKNQFELLDILRNGPIYKECMKLLGCEWI